MFILQVVFNRIKRAWLSSMIMLLQFIIGFSLLCACISIIISLQNNEAQYRSEVKNMLRISWQGESAVDSVSYLSAKDQSRLKKYLGDNADLLMIYQASVPVFYKADNDANNKAKFVNLLFLDPQYASLLGELKGLDVQNKSDMQSFLKLKNAGVFLPKVALDALQHNFQFGNIKSAVFEGIVKDIVSSHFTIDAEAQPPEMYIVTTDINALSEHLPKDSQIQCFVLPKNDHSVDLGKLSHFLNELHPIGVQFYIFDMMHPVSFEIEHAQLLNKTLLTLAVVVIVAVSIGFTGSILMNAQKRKKEIYILLCIGTPKRTLYREMLLETCLIVVSGALLGIALSYPTIALIPAPQLSLSIQIAGAVISLLIALTEAIGFTWLQIRQVNSVNIATALKEERA